MAYHIYMLKHRPTSKFYIGSTRNLKARRAHWFTKIRKGETHAAIQLLSRTASDWDVISLQEFSNIDLRRLRFIEHTTILDALRNHYDLLLNVQVSGLVPKKLVARSTYYMRQRKLGMTAQAAAETPNMLRIRAVTQVMDGKKPLTQKQASERLGCQVKSLQKRLKQYRKSRPHATSVDISYLLQLTRQFRMSP